MSESSKKERAVEIQDSIRQVLFRDWDPIGLADAGLPEDEYDSYIGPVYRILIGTRSEDDLIEYLQETALETIGVSGRPRSALQEVAKKLLRLNVSLK